MNKIPAALREALEAPVEGINGPFTATLLDRIDRARAMAAALRWAANHEADLRDLPFCNDFDEAIAALDPGESDE